MKKVKKIMFMAMGIFSLLSCTTTQKRVMERFDVTVFDYEYFPSRKIARGTSVRKFTENHDPRVESNLACAFGSENLDDFIEKTETQALIVIRDENILLEKYGRAFDRSSTVTSFSVAKVFDSVMIGCLIAEGKISSERESIVRWLPELKERDPDFEKITIEHLMKMSSGIKYREGGLFADDTAAYWNPELRKLVLEKIKIAEEPGKHFLYNNYNPILLGLIIERASGMSVCDYMSRSIWSRVGAEHDASWSLDSDEDAFEKMESGINGTALDFARFGCMIRDKGIVSGTKVIPYEWIEKSLADDGNRDEYYGYKNKWGPQILRGINGGHYGYFWYSMHRQDGTDDFFAYGNLGQIVYISPSRNTVMVRFGCNYGIEFWDYIRAFYNLNM